MAKKHRPTIKNAEPYQPEGMYINFRDKESTEALGKAVSEYRIIANNRRRDFHNIGGPNISARPGLIRDDYDAYRPDEADPSCHRDLMLRCDKSYKKNPIVRNIVDLMADFTVQGIRIIHKNKRKQNFCNNWAAKVHFQERSERIANSVYRLANVLVYRKNAKISAKVKENMYKAKAADYIVNDSDDQTLDRREIPWEYTILDPVYVEPLGGSLASFSNKKLYGIKLSPQQRKDINKPKTPEEKAVVESLPQPIKDAAKSNTIYPLDPDKVRAIFYKKDDWQPWASPMMEACLDDIATFDKLRLADNAALDGAVSNVRVWTIGSLEHDLAPTAAAANKLSELLESHVGCGTQDLIWGPDLKCTEMKTNVHEFLGSEKYAPTVNAIYACFGIPPSLTGSAGTKEGASNNVISLQTLVERLKYVRARIVEFWNYEFKLLADSLGWDTPPTLEFGFMNLTDSTAEKALYRDMYDRNLISDEALRLVFNLDDDMETLRLNREEKQREKGTRLPKSTPYHDPQFELAFKKIALQAGMMLPEADTENEEGGGVQLKINEDFTLHPEPTGVSGQGRPLNKKDSVKRKKRKHSPTSKAKEVWAYSTLEEINKMILPTFLEHTGKKNMRQLTNAEFEELEIIKFGVLSNLEAFTDLTEDNLTVALSRPLPFPLFKKFKLLSSAVSSQLDKALTVDQSRLIMARIYADDNSRIRN